MNLHNFYSPMGNDPGVPAEPDYENMTVELKPRTRSELYYSVLSGKGPTKNSVVYENNNVIFTEQEADINGMTYVYYKAVIALDNATFELLNECLYSGQSCTVLCDNTEFNIVEPNVDLSNPAADFTYPACQVYSAMGHNFELEYYFRLVDDVSRVSIDPLTLTVSTAKSVAPQPRTRDEYWLAKLAGIQLDEKDVILYEKTIAVPDNALYNGTAEMGFAFDTIENFRNFVPEGFEFTYDNTIVMINDNAWSDFSENIDAFTINYDGKADPPSVRIWFQADEGAELTDLPAVGDIINIKIIGTKTIELVPYTREEHLVENILRAQSKEELLEAIKSVKTNKEIYLSLLGGTEPKKSITLLEAKMPIWGTAMTGNGGYFTTSSLDLPNEILDAFNTAKSFRITLDNIEIPLVDSWFNSEEYPCGQINTVTRKIIIVFQGNRTMELNSNTHIFKFIVDQYIDSESAPKPKTREEYWLAKFAGVPITRKKIIFDRVVEVPDSIDTDNESYAFVAITMYDSVTAFAEIITNWATANNLDPEIVAKNLGDENFKFSFNPGVDGMVVRMGAIPSEEPGGDETFGLIIDYNPKTGFDISNFPAVGAKIEVKSVYYIPVELVPRTRHEKFMQDIYDYKTNNSSDPGTGGKPDDPINGGKI